MDSNALHWLRAAKDDLDAIDELLRNPNLTNIAAFHAQQAIEKTFKALLEYEQKDVPKSHNLEKLYGYVQHLICVDDFSTLEMINEIYIDSRYPGDLGILPAGKPSLQITQKFRRMAQDIFHQAGSILQDTTSEQTP
ncbi:HEPN domain-containing protein [Desulfurispirillum indicum]|uniref:HEPN domain-containing protein n=1 Tax=Desulfurispirillum indicum TaxID=936456 RepID=UPI001CFA019B|nr:HEPN domain-containing protein [Desulfurispirillum indicum]UCZ56936.1 HEPN domain-containing protein [Desulfurispirillum indicum]